jgi:hypothetical protein
MFFFALLAGCDQLEKVGAYTCDQYCDQVLAKTTECATAAAKEQCEAAGGTDCDTLSEDELSAYAAEGRDDWAGASKDEMIASCEDDIASAGKTDAECQAETATINNLSCDDILDLLGEIAAAAQ